MNLKNSNVKIKIPKVLRDKLNNRKINQIYKNFENSLSINENFAVAVSGGPDSLALAFLAKIFAIKKKLIAQFYIVDHKLRPESTKEAKVVKKILKRFFITSKILTWRGQKPLKNISSIARKKRYELIFDECDKTKIKNILVGHHQGDLFENFFIRMLRGSGLKGLISLDLKGKFGEKYLLRPLLYHKKEDLIFLSKKVFNTFIQDPTNEDEKYKRIRIRKLIEELQKNGLDNKKFLKTVNNLKYSNEVVNFYVNKNLQENSNYIKKNDKLILNKIFFEQPYEIIFRSISETIKSIGKKYHYVRGKKLDKIIDDIINNESFRVTLGGCIIEKVSQSVIISKEH